MDKLIVTMSDMKRYKVITEVINKRLSLKDAAELLSLSYRHAIRLKERIAETGLEGILRKIPPCPPNRKITPEMTDTILKLRKKLYHDFNFMHFKDKLEEVHNINISYESLRKILIRNNVHTPKKKKIVHRQRRRMPKAGMLVQMDSSLHRWLEHLPEKWWLIAMIDDATNEVPYAWLFPGDTLFANMHVIRQFIELKGIFMSLYVDKAAHFKTTRYGGLHYSITNEQEDTQIERALNELGITVITANSPQAKGRIEVTFRLFQDRLIKEMRLAGIKDYKEANKYIIQKFLPWYNAKYTHKAENVYMPVPKGKNMELIFCLKRQRKVNKDNTISFNGQIIQIPPSEKKLSFAKTRVDVCWLEDNRIFLLYENKVITESVLSKDNSIAEKEKKIEGLLSQRQYVPLAKRGGVKSVPMHHPWKKKLFDKRIKLQQIRESKRQRKEQKKIANACS